jgi:inner membrane protein
MDNLTHSLTGALAAKILATSLPVAFEEPAENRKAFWLLVASVNIPDIDVALGFFSDPIFSIHHHRGLTHSFVFAPALALLPAVILAKLGNLKNFKILWLYASLGIYLHIFFDLITPFGTQLLAPFSNSRYSLDWMFIIDPFFTGILGTALLLARILKSRRRKFLVGGAIFVVLYLLLEAINHNLADKRMAAALKRDGIAATKISAFPQPLSIFRWMGLAQTERGVVQTFFSVIGNGRDLQFTKYENASDDFVAQALQAPETGWYLNFARHPWIRSEPQGDSHVVELRDLQFSIDKNLLQAVGLPERRSPFAFRYIFSLHGEDAEIIFNGKRVRRDSYKEPHTSAP